TGLIGVDVGSDIGVAHPGQVADGLEVGGHARVTVGGNLEVVGVEEVLHVGHIDPGRLVGVAQGLVHLLEDLGGVLDEALPLGQVPFGLTGTFGGFVVGDLVGRVVLVVQQVGGGEGVVVGRRDYLYIGTGCLARPLGDCGGLGLVQFQTLVDALHGQGEIVVALQVDVVDIHTAGEVVAADGECDEVDPTFVLDEEILGGLHLGTSFVL